MIAIKKGTTDWRQADRLAADEVEFTGAWLSEADGRTPAMVWDDALGNVRPITQVERDLRDAPRIAGEADKSDFATQYAAAITRIDEIILQNSTRTNAQAQAAITDLARIVKRHLKYTKAS